MYALHLSTRLTLCSTTTTSLSVNARSEAERRAAAAEVAKQAAEEAAAALRAEEALMDADEVTTLWAEVHAVKGLTPPAGSKAREYSVAVRVSSGVRICLLGFTVGSQQYWCLTSVLAYRCWDIQPRRRPN